MGIFNRKQKDVEIRQVSENTDNTNNMPSYPVGLEFLYNRTAGDPTTVSSFYAATEIIANTIATIPIHIRNVDNNEILSSHPLNFIWNSGLQTKFMLFKSLIWDMLLSGNGIAYINRAKDGTPIELIYCPPGNYTIQYDSLNRKLYYLIPFLSKKKVEPINVLHFIKNSRDGVQGEGIPKYALQSLNLAKATNKSAEKFFDSGCKIDGVLTSEKVMGQQQKNEAKESWERIYGRYGSGGGVAVLGNDWKFQPVAQNNQSSQMLESRTFNITELARYFTISPTLLGDLSHTQYGSLEAAQADFISHTLLPMISMIQDEMNRKLLKPSERGKVIIDLDEDHIYLSDKTSTANYLSTLTNAGIMTINEARHVIGLNPVEGGDENRIPYSDANQNMISNQNSNKQNNNTQSNENK